jgi:L-ascorbate metabolism protein UlaG (beta-lactamase superfamily)
LGDAAVFGGMGRFPLRLVVLSLVVAGIVPAASPDGHGVEMVYLANEGFMIRSGDRAVLVDALFGDGIGGYPAVPEEIRRDMESGEPPFGRVQLVLATHQHGDHFDPAAVARFLDSHPEALFVSTEDAVRRLMDRLPETSSVRSRILAAAPDPGGPIRIEHDGLTVEAFDLHHGHGMEPPIANLGFIVEIGGVKLLHVGDTEVTAEEFRRSGAADRRVDVALLSYWTLDRLDPLVGASRNVLMHLPAADAPRGYFAPRADLEELIRSLLEQDRDAFLPTRAMDRLHVTAEP